MRRRHFSIFFSSICCSLCLNFFSMMRIISTSKIYDGKIEERSDDHRRKIRCHFAARTDNSRAESQIDDPYHADDGCLFEQGNQLVADGGNDIFDRLRDDYVQHRLPLAQPQRARRFRLPRIHRLDTAAQTLCDICARIDAESKNSRQFERKSTNRQNRKRHNKQLQRHRACRG